MARTFSVAYDEMVIVKDIEFFSLCEHHLLPFFGKAHVGLSAGQTCSRAQQDARVVNMFARRLQIQERLTSQIAKSIEEKIAPQGVGVIIEARHLCMQMRGVEKQHGSAVTSAMLGAFRHNKQTRDEFLALIRPERADGGQTILSVQFFPNSRPVKSILALDSYSSSWLRSGINTA